MTAASEIPADVMAAAREVVVSHLLTVVTAIPGPMRLQIDEGYFDSWPVYAVAARAILTERQRCMDVAERVTSEGGKPVDVYFAIQGPAI
jgi:hypothetical protein